MYRDLRIIAALFQNFCTVCCQFVRCFVVLLKFYDSKVQFSNYCSMYNAILPLKLILPILLTYLDFIIMFHHSHRTVFTVKKILSLWSATTLLLFYSRSKTTSGLMLLQLSIATTTVISNWTICSIIISSSNKDEARTNLPFLYVCQSVYIINTCSSKTK